MKSPRQRHKINNKTIPSKTERQIKEEGQDTIKEELTGRHQSKTHIKNMYMGIQMCCRSCFLSQCDACLMVLILFVITLTCSDLNRCHRVHRTWTTHASKTLKLLSRTKEGQICWPKTLWELPSLIAKSLAHVSLRGCTETDDELCKDNEEGNNQMTQTRKAKD